MCHKSLLEFPESVHYGWHCISVQRGRKDGAPTKTDSRKGFLGMGSLEGGQNWAGRMGSARRGGNSGSLCHWLLNSLMSWAARHGSPRLCTHSNSSTETHWYHTGVTQGKGANAQGDLNSSHPLSPSCKMKWGVVISTFRLLCGHHQRLAHSHAKVLSTKIFTELGICTNHLIYNTQTLDPVLLNIISPQ